MAITPRTIFTNPASAALAAASLFTMTAASMYVLNTSCSSSPCEITASATYESPCASVRDAIGPDASSWSEFGWFTYAECYGEQNDSSKVVEVTTQGLRHYPASSALYNMKGYHQIKMGEHASAVKTLEEGMRRVGRSANSVMANNLAWAGVWAPREMDASRARQLYKASLAQAPKVCETLHTGMWVEYSIAKTTDGFERAAALRAFHGLSESYEVCEDRYKDGEWDTLIEVLGAAVIKADVARDLDCGMKGASEKQLLQEVSAELRKRYRGSSIDALCRESIPVAAAHHACVDLIDTQVTDRKSVV